VRDTVYGGLLKRARATLHVDFVTWADKVNAERGRGLEFEEILGYHLEQAHRYLSELGPLDAKGREIGRDAARRLYAAGRRSFARGDPHAASNLLHRAIALLADDDPLRLPMLPDVGEVLLEQGKFAEAKAIVDEAHTKAEAIGNQRVAAAAVLTRMQLQQHSGDSGSSWVDATQELTTTTIPMLEAEGAHAELARAWRLVAMVQQSSGHLGEAVGTIAKVIEHARLAGDDRLMTRSALGLTLCAIYGPTPVAEAIQQCEALIAGDFGDRQVQSLVICKIAHLHAMNGDPETGRQSAREARAVLRDLGQGVRSASSSLDLAMVEMLAGDPAAAEREVRDDVEMLEAMGETYFLSTMVAVLAWAVRDQGRDDEALELTRTAESTAAPDDIDAQVMWRCVRAPILARKGKIEEAETMAQAALDLARQTDLPGLLGFALSELAVVLRLAGRFEDARRLLVEAMEIYSRKGDVSSSGMVTAALERLQESGLPAGS
jgi:tetratricopeptide (TPR) repeat protein